MFSRIIAYKLSIDLVLLRCKIFLFLLARFLIFLVFFPKNSKHFLGFLSTILKNLPTSPRGIAKVLAINSKNLKISFVWKPNRQTLGILSHYWLAYRYLSSQPLNTILIFETFRYWNVQFFLAQWRRVFVYLYISSMVKVMSQSSCVISKWLNNWNFELNIGATFREVLDNRESAKNSNYASNSFT